MKPALLLALASLSGAAGYLLGGSQGFVVAMESWGIALEVAILGSWPIRRARAKVGVETFRIPNDSRPRAILVGAGLATLAGAGALFLIGGNGVVDRLFNGLVLLLAPIFVLEGAISTQFTGERILRFERFLRWSSVGAYSWNGQHLLLWPNAEERLPWWGLAWIQHRLMDITVPEENREKVEELLIRRLPGCRTDDSLRRLLGEPGNPKPRAALDLQAQVRDRLKEGDEGEALRLIRDSTSASDSEAQALIERLRGDGSAPRISRSENEISS
jgi:hypothetical protein